MESATAIIGAVSNRGWHVVRLAVAALLLVAAVLKCWQLTTEPVIGNSWLDSRWLLMATVEFELFFGLWLLAGILPKPTWAAAVACFSLFTCVSLYKALSGHASCGCFGRVQVNPWFTSTLDLAIVASLLRWRPSSTSPLPPGEGKGEGSQTLSLVPITAVLLLWLAAGLPAAYAMGSYSPTTLSDAGDIIGNAEIVVLEPEKWIGKRFPLLDYIDIGDKLKEGKWLVLLYHHNCPKCQETIKDLRQVIRPLGIQQVALVEMPPYGDSDGVANSSGMQLVHGRLDDTRVKEWFAETPILLESHDGYVTKTHQAERPDKYASRTGEQK